MYTGPFILWDNTEQKFLIFTLEIPLPSSVTQTEYWRSCTNVQDKLYLCLLMVAVVTSTSNTEDENDHMWQVLHVIERMRRSHRHAQGSESQTKQKSVSGLGIKPRLSDLRSDALPIKLLRPTPWPHHSTSLSSHCGQRRHCHLSGCRDTNSAWLPAPDTRETLFLLWGELSSRLGYSSRY